MRDKPEALFDGLTIRERILVLTFIEGLKKIPQGRRQPCTCGKALININNAIIA